MPSIRSVGVTVATAVVGFALWQNIPAMTDQGVTLDWLKETELTRLDNQEKFKEGSKLSSAMAKFESKIPLYGVAHESLGVPEFKEFFKGGEVFLDTEKRFFGPKQRWMGYSGFFNPGVWSNIMRTKKAGVSGNLEGEGRLLGAVFVLGPGDKGIVYEHYEQKWGDIANMDEVSAAVEGLLNA